VVKGLEWAQLVTDEDDEIQIQHLLQVGNPAEPMVIKHWREDWLFENTDLYSYSSNNEWKFKNSFLRKSKDNGHRKYFR